jgi:hypothetical protein
VELFDLEVMIGKILGMLGLERTGIVDTSKVKRHRGRSGLTHLIAVLAFNNRKTQNWQKIAPDMKIVVRGWEWVDVGLCNYFVGAAWNHGCHVEYGGLVVQIAGGRGGLTMIIPEHILF